MKYICAWCEVELQPPDKIHEGKISHGMCQECQKKVQKEIDDYKANK